MGTEIENSRPNIRIEIVNNVTEKSEEKMEVDPDLSENEEGEISDDDINIDTSEIVESDSPNRKVSATNAVFTTGINIFDKKEQEKLQERAKRFALKPDEIHSFTDQDLQDLHESLGINPTNESEVKFETIHLIGLEDMSAEDVVDYFANYAPEGIEWIDKNSCNVIWLDNLSAARALHFKSRVVRGMPAREPKDLFPKEFLDNVDESEPQNGQSVLIRNQNREIELQNEIGEIILPKKKTYPKNSVDISEITIPVPPGYWRLGNPHPKTKCLLVRFGLITDKLPLKTEKCSKYYKKLSSNPNQRNVISDVKKKELRSIFERNKELDQNKNPWGSLAKNWDKDARFREREPIIHNLDDDDDEVQIVEIKNPKLKARLGVKRKLSQSDEEKIGETEENNGTNPKLTSDKKTIKLPRMKMYADEEEENQKRRKILMRIQKQAEVIEKRDNEKDLRHMLGPANRLTLRKEVPVPDPQIDLGSRLKNRSQRLVFSVGREAVKQESYDYDDYDTRRIYPDVDRDVIVRSLARGRERSPLLSVSRSVLIRAREQRETVSPERDRRSEKHRHNSRSRSSRKRTPERTLHSDRMHSSRSHHSRRRSYSPERRRDGKPRSKVAVVIKTPKKPAVASTIWSKVKKTSESEESSSESESESEDSENSSSQESSSSSSSSSESKSDSGESDQDSESSMRSSNRQIAARNPDRPGFDKSRLSQKVDHKSPLKITTTNEHFSVTQRKLRKF